MGNLGAVRLLRSLSIASIVSLVLFVLLAATTNAAAIVADSGPISGGSVSSSLKAAGLLLSASGLGACFAALTKANRYVESRTYDHSYDGTYWTLIVLGLIAGVVLALVIPIETIAGQENLSKPLLALLGGFSASAVHRILTSVLNSVEALFKGEPEDRTQVIQETMAAQSTAELTRLRSDIGAQVVQVMESLSGHEKDVAQERLQSLLDLLLDVDRERHGANDTNVSSASQEIHRSSSIDLSGRDLHGATLKGVDLSEADLSDANLAGADLTEAICIRSIFVRADLSGASLTAANLVGADLSQAKLTAARLGRVNMANADLSTADLSSANASKANMTGANIANANFSEANLVDSCLAEANLVGVVFSGALLDGADLAAAVFDDSTVWPDGFSPPIA
jgi:uncharacterized protein YjbI with pentapeptide repeats